jgi:poly(A) polymerase/tRNA nucleotidyltransferase (CCA-adding enzyme)
MDKFLDEIPQAVKNLIETAQSAGFECYIVGGCVRDLLAGAVPSDWDAATNANPGQIQEIFPDSYADNQFGTIRVRAASSSATPMESEITPYRVESKYTDKRHPDTVEWADNISDDLSRRDFTVNAMALSYTKENGRVKVELMDPFGGQKDLRAKIIRAVRDPEERFSEDALRMMRAARFAATLGAEWEIEENTRRAVVKHSGWMKAVSGERIRDEFLKIIMSPSAARGVELLRELKLLEHIIPELLEGYGCGQNKHHIYDCYHHLIKSLDYAAKKNFGMHVRMASLLHDIGKPAAKSGDGPDATFYNHEIIGARLAKKILQRLKLSKKDTDKIVLLVRYHLFYYNVGEVSESSVRRLVKNVGRQNLEELLQVRMADRIGSGCPKAEPYKLRHLRYLMERVAQDPISPKMIKVNGKDIMETLKIVPGPKVGQILEVLLGEILEDPARNDRDYLIARAGELGALDEEKLSCLAAAGKQRRGQVEIKRDEMTKKRYWVV